MPRVLIADDEPHLRRYLARLLAERSAAAGLGDIELCAEAGSGEEALARIARYRPEIAFLDIRMPAPSGIEVARRLADAGDAPLVVFVTAYDDHAVEAFEAAAVDYLLKPVDRERLDRCLRRLAPRLRREPASGPDGPTLAAVLDRLARLEARSAPLRWLRAGHGEATELVPVDDVVFFRAGDKYVSALTRDREHVLRTTLKELLLRLDPDRFWQIHRSVIVNAGQIERARRDLRGRYVLTLRDRPEELRCSLAFADLFRAQ